MSVYRGPLGREKPPDQLHVEKYPLKGVVLPTPIPVSLGISWYEGYDEPVKGQDGRFRVKISGQVRGGHDVCLEPNLDTLHDDPAWWEFYNQGETPACVGFAHARALTLHYRQTFNPFWLYDDARRAEGSYPNGEGSTNRAACAALKRWGAHTEGGLHAKPEKWHWHIGDSTAGIVAYRWATTADEVLAALGYKSGAEVPLLNSWGKQYPERVYVSPEDLARLLTEEGEADVVTDR